MAAKTTIDQRRLRAGIEAIKAGNRVRGRDLLLQVVRHHSGMEEAWWWLANAADDPQEKLRALENVLRLNPENDAAHTMLSELRQRQLAEAGRGSRPNWGQLLPEVPFEVDDGIDDPFQCPACGWPTQPDDRRCRECRARLFWRIARPGPGAIPLRTVRSMLFVNGALALLQTIGPLFALALALGTVDTLGFEVVLRVAGVRQVFGNFLALSSAEARRLLQIEAVRVVGFAALLVGLRERWKTAYYSAMLVLVGDGLLNFYLLSLGDRVGFILVLGSLAAALVGFVALFGASYEFAVNSERILVKPDTKARGPVDFYRRGHDYRRHGQWALAVAQWRKAVGLAPSMAGYYKDLGIGYAQIRRFDRSLRVLEEARRQAPDDPAIEDVIRLVRAKAETDSMLKR